MKRLLSVLLAGMLLCTGCTRNGETGPGSSGKTAAEEPAEPAEPTEPAELRGVWVSHLDLKALLSGTDPASAAERLDGVMDTCREKHLNTVFFHVRSHSDAYYRSEIFPAAAVAKPLLESGFDPLAYAVDAAHKRGLTLHAWINPYRIGSSPDNRVTSADASFCHGGMWYYDPASDEARRKILGGVREILRDYAVDGIHFDDYFYPSGLAAAGESFEAIPAGMTAGDWRRAQVNALVSGVWGLTHAAGRIFGISPSAHIKRCRENACADTALWLRQGGYVDYLCPQIYFGFEHQTAPFAQLVAQWCALPRREGVALYVGLAFYKCGMDNDPYAGTGRQEWSRHDDMIARQVQTVRDADGFDGFVLFRYAQLTDTALQTEWKHLESLL